MKSVMQHPVRLFLDKYLDSDLCAFIVGTAGKRLEGAVCAKRN